MTLLCQFALLALQTAVLLCAQGVPFRDVAPNIKVDSDLVLINALVTDRQGRVITGLDASKFRLSEDGKEQDVKYCVSEDVPVSVGLILDTSGSMGDKLGLLKQAALQFVRSGNQADEYFLIEFHNRPRLVLSLTGDVDRVRQSISDLKAGGNTALLDAVHLAVSESRHANNSRKALLLISDGLDNHSRHKERETKRLLSELDLPIYAIDVYERPTGNRYAIQRQETGLLEAISAPTGGRSFSKLDPKKLSSVADLIASEIRHEYVIAYAPSNHERDGKFRRVRVRLEPRPGQMFQISHRRGYYAPVP